MGQLQMFQKNEEGLVRLSTRVTLILRIFEIRLENNHFYIKVKFPIFRFLQVPVIGTGDTAKRLPKNLKKFRDLLSVSIKELRGAFVTFQKFVK